MGRRTKLWKIKGENICWLMKDGIRNCSILVLGI